MARVAVIGPGSVGGFFAAHLTAAGHDVLSCARRPFTEYVVESPETPVRVPATVLTDPSQVPDGPAMDVILLCVKVHQTEEAAGWIKALCGPGVAMVTVQNGVEGHLVATPYADGGDVIAGVVYCGAELIAPGHIIHSSGRRLIISDDERCQRVVSLIGGSPAEVVASDDYTTEAWRKLGANVVLNGTTGLTLQAIEVMRDPAMAKLAANLIRECYAVGRAEGATLSDEDGERFVNALAKMPAGSITSMLQDRRAGRSTEHDAIYGSLVRAGVRHGIPTPCAETLLALLGAAAPVQVRGSYRSEETNVPSLPSASMSASV